ncbi:MAG: L-rhamnose mutarotase [Candidatus Hydrogenedentes bacterium]|nr:L-rhamnose mutarotase [Candidatus Hydrogenedentota bacterium]
MKRYGMVTKVLEGKLDEYKRLHAQVWPEVLRVIQQCNIQNYSIYSRGEYLFSYFEYVGNDFEADMAKMVATPITLKWWAVCTPCLDPLPPRAKDQWWSPMEEVFHLD